jgi:hypothetical protein
MRGLWILLLALLPALGAQAQPSIAFERGDRVIFLGNTFAERLYHFGHLELLLASRFEQQNLSFRNLGWSADEITLMPRPLDFGGVHEHLTMQKASVIFLFYGFNESFAGEAGLEEFKKNYGDFVDGLMAHPFAGTKPARLVAVTPYPMENRPEILGGVERQNADIKRYADAIAEVAASRNIACANIYEAVAQWQQQYSDFPITFNGIHLTDFGDWVVSRIIMASLGMPAEAMAFSQDVANPRAYVKGPGVRVVKSDGSAVELELRLDYLTDVEPPAAGEALPREAGTLQLKGLPAGRYTLTLPGGATLEGDAEAWAAGLPLGASPFNADSQAIRRDINYKNRLFFDKWRAINGYYIYGGRKEPFGVISFPPEMERFEERAAEYDGRIQQALRKPWSVKATLRRVGE